MLAENSDVVPIEGARNASLTEDMDMDKSERAPEARDREAAEMPKGYFHSLRFIGVYCAIGFGFMAATGCYALIAPLLGEINADIGPSANITWVALAYLLCQSVVFLIVGRLSDIFGRRWFFIVGSILGLIGSILGATAQSVNQLIGAQVFIGIAAGFQISFFWVVAELVPMKWRYIANSGLYAFTIPTNPLAPKIAFAYETQTSVKWRGCFYFMIAVNFVSVLCWYFFYHPPTFKMLHRRTAAKDLIKNFDWVGFVLYSGGLLVFLMGLVWGATLYPWKSGHVIGTVIGGGCVFILFILWEIFLPLKNTTPFLPLHLFKNLRYMACAWLTAIGAATYYGFSLIWPAAVSVLYTDLSDSRRGTIYGVVVMGFVFGQIIGGFVATVTGPKPGIIVCMTLAAPLLMACAANPLNMNLTMGLITAGSFFIGMMERIAICTPSFPLRSQEEIGTAGGLSGAIRAFGSILAVAIYATTIANRLNTTIPANVIPAAKAAGVPVSSIPTPIMALGGTNTTAVPGLTPGMLAVSEQAYKVANAQAYRTIFLASFAFGGLGMVICWFVAQNDRSKDNFVGANIHRVADEKALETESG